jgi:hypothetical protein
MLIVRTAAVEPSYCQRFPLSIELANNVPEAAI